jgi:hypothetical protein
VADKDVVFDRNAFAKERVTRDLAPAAYLYAFLYFDKRTDAALIPDLTAVGIDERIDLYILAERDVAQPNEIVPQIFVGKCRHLKE